MAKNKWYRLDNAGKLYPSITNTRRSTVFRLSAKMAEEVDPVMLQKSLEATVQRLPYYKVNLKRGLFWYYFEEADHMPRVQPETHYPCMFMSYRTRKTFPFRVLHYHRYIHLEISHSIADGSGALIFLKTLLIQYTELRQAVRCRTLDSSVDVQVAAEAEEYEDAFSRYYRKGAPTAKSQEAAVHFPFTLMEKGKYSLMTGIVPLEVIRSQSKAFDCSVTQLVAAVYFLAIQDYAETSEGALGKAMMGRIVLNIPVDLRRLFPSKTMKNFFVSLTPEIDLRLGHYELEETIDYLKGYMKMGLNTKAISKYISRNVKNERHPLIRILPLGLKNIVMPFIYVWFGERGYTSSISNLGKVELPPEIMPYVDAIEFFPAPSEVNKIKMCMTAYKDRVFLSFGKTTNNTEIETYFYRRLVKMGIPVKLETNMNQTSEIKGGR